MTKLEKIYIRNGIIAFHRKGKQIVKYPNHIMVQPQTMNKKESLVIKFCSNSSIRGLSRISTNQNISLKWIWIIFLLSMSALLIVGSLSLTFEYLQYNTLVNSRENHEMITTFPDITLCNLYPFHMADDKMWMSSSVLSPLEFNAIIRQMMRDMYLSNYSLARLLFSSDTITSYFETIGPERAKMISHDSSQIVYCLLLLKNSKIKVGHHNECGIRIKTVPHNQFLSCQSIRIHENYSTNAVALGLIIHMDDLSKKLNTMELGLVQDVLKQAHGLRIILHEPHTLADLSLDGFNVEPGKFTDVKFSAVKWIKINTPKEPCWSEETIRAKENRSAYNFRYTYDTCKNEEIGKLIHKECHCYSSKYPLPYDIGETNATFCSNVDPRDAAGVLERLRCLDALESLEPIKTVMAENKCVRRCSYMTYECHLTTANWALPNWKLYWLMIMNDALTALGSGNQSEAVENATRIFQEYVSQSKSNLTNSVKNLTKTNDDVFLIINRQSFMTLEKIEVFSLTRSALLSRLGGLSSITLGFTFTTIFEIAEFFITFLQGWKNRRG